MTQIEGNDAFVVMESCEPVLFRSDSSQRKNDVLIHQSKRFPDKCSEWYFVRRNKNTRNETYRCVHCRSVHEKARRRKNAAEIKGEAVAKDPALTGEVVAADPALTTGSATLRPGARIVVHDEFFVVNPDFPLGAHICDFEHNSASDSHVVWSRRALIRANSELRLNPEKPKVKFQQMLESIERGDGEYAYLSTQLRKNIIEHLTSEKGFDSRRRSFARNNSMALKRMRERKLRDELYAGDPTLGGYANGGRHQLTHYEPSAEGGGAASTAVYRAVRQVVAKCGMPGCNLTFRSEVDRAHHRLVIHPGVYFVDSYEEFTEYRDLVLESNGRYMDEVITTEYGRIVDVGVFDRPDGGQPALDFYVVDEQQLDHYDHDDVHYYEDEGVEMKSTPLPALGGQQAVLTAIVDAGVKVANEPSNRQRLNNNGVADGSTPVLEKKTTSKTSGVSNFLGQIDSMLTQIHNCAAAVANYPIRRDAVENTIHNMMNECIGDAASVDKAKRQGGRCPPPIIAGPSSVDKVATTFRRRSSSGFYDFDDECEADGRGYEMTAEEASFYTPLPKRKRPNILSVQKV